MIKLSKSSIGNEEKEAVMEVLQDEYLGMGSKVQEFENKLEDFFKERPSDRPGRFANRVERSAQLATQRLSPLGD